MYLPHPIPAVSEAYMAGDVQVSSLKDFMDVSVAPIMHLTIPNVCL